MSDNMYALIGKMALEFRLSLGNICKLLGKEPTDENKMEVYKKIMEVNWDLDVKNSYNYLFHYETINEDNNTAIMARSKAAVFLKKYSEALREQNQEKINLLLKQLIKTEEDFDRIRKNGLTLNEEEITIISKYRLKHCISKTQMGYILDVDRRVLLTAENKITNPSLRAKLVKISEFFEDITIGSRKKK